MLSTKTAAALVFNVTLPGLTWGISEWLCYSFFGDGAGEGAVMLGALLLPPTIGWRLARFAAFDSRWGAGVSSALIWATLSWINLSFLKWLWVAPQGRLTAGEFGWVVPLYVNVVCVGGALLCLAIAVAIWRQPESKGSVG